MSLQPPQGTQRAFTLVELLVVIGIIALLIGILLPVLSKVRERARELKCAANLHAIGQGLMLYVQDYRYYPGYETPEHYAIWPIRIRNALGGNMDVFYCPSKDSNFQWTKHPASGIGDGPATAADARYGYELGEMLLNGGPSLPPGYLVGLPGGPIPFSYGYNAGGITEGEPWAFQKGLGFVVQDVIHLPGRADSGEIPASRVRSPSEMIAVADIAGWQPPIISPHVMFKAPGGIHRGGANVLFCDGHVQWFLVNDLVAKTDLLTDYRLIKMWYSDQKPALP